jgi:hypothetical protein
MTEMDWIGIAIGFAAGAILVGGIWYGLTKKRQRQLKIGLEKFTREMEKFRENFWQHAHATPMGKTDKPVMIPCAPPLPHEDKRGDSSDKG